MHPYLIAIGLYLLVGLGCFVCIFTFFPPRDGPAEDLPDELDDLSAGPLPWTPWRLLSASFGAVSMLLFSPLILVVLCSCWLRERRSPPNHALQRTAGGRPSFWSRLFSRRR